MQLLGVLREVVAEQTPGHGADLGGLGAVRGAGDHQRRARVGRPARAAGRHDRPAVRLAQQRQRRGPGRAAGRAAARRPSAREVLLAQPRAALELHRPDLSRRRSNEMLRSRPVGVARGLDERAGRCWPGTTSRRPVGLQRRLRPGARRAGPQAGAGAGLRTGRRAGRGRGALHDLRRHRRQLRGAGAFGLARLRVSPGRRARAVAALDLVPSTSRAFSDARRLRAVALSRPDGGLPELAQALAASTASGSTRRAGRLTAGSSSGRWPRSSRRGTAEPADDRAVRRATDSLRDGLEATYRELARQRRRPGPLPPGRPGQRRTKVDPA